MVRIFKYLKFCFIPLCFMLTACGLMTSVSALEPPVENGTVGNTFKFRINKSAWEFDEDLYVYFGIEIYYRIFTSSQSGSIISLTTSSQLASNGFKRIYRTGDTTDYFVDPVLYFEDPYTYKTSGYDFIDFTCYFDDTGDPATAATLTVTYFDHTGTPIPGAQFELKRSVSFPDAEPYPIAKRKIFKGFNEFEENDNDINADIWNLIDDSDGIFGPVYLILYAYSFGYSLEPGHILSQIESRLVYLQQLIVNCKVYEP